MASALRAGSSETFVGFKQMMEVYNFPPRRDEHVESLDHSMIPELLAIENGVQRWPFSHRGLASPTAAGIMQVLAIANLPQPAWSRGARRFRTAGLRAQSEGGSSAKPLRDRLPDYLPDRFPTGIDLFPCTTAELERLETESPELHAAIALGREI